MPGDLNSDGSYVFKKSNPNEKKVVSPSQMTPGEKLMLEFKKSLKARLTNGSPAKPVWGKAMPKS